MCGFWAIFGCDEDVACKLSSCMKIRHRGPDAFRIENINHFKNCALGFQRLAVVADLKGMQPFRVHAFPHLALVYNGEIYNGKLLGEQMGFNYETDLDGECILHLYKKGGAEFAAAHLDGVFAFTILDCEKRLVVAGRDTYGVRPSFRLETENGFLALSSEVKGLIGLSKGENTKYEEKITPFPPGHVAVYSLDEHSKIHRVSEERFHAPGQVPRYTTRITDLVHTPEEEIYRLLKESVRKRMMGARRIGCLLSGGLDSSLVASLVSEIAKETELGYKIQTFSIGMDGSPDVLAARKVAKHLDTDHHEITFTPEEGVQAVKDVIYHNESYDITTTRASVGMYLLAKYISEKTDNIIIFSGEGADELAQGYIYFHKSPSAEEADAESRRLLHDLYMYDNLRADRTTAAHGLELRVPFLDHQLTSYFLSLPAASRVPRNGVEKYLLRSAFAGKDLIPEEILWRPKEAFSDGVSSQKKSWFAILQDFIEEQVSDEELTGASSLYPFNTPVSKEGYYYRKLFESSYPNQSQLIKYIWMPKWIGATDPSARTLKHYKDSEVEHCYAN
ncbi:asparagine synthetase [glutamine-hydrolyzing]-like [Watersipora subatra]|uniref:asparagine synthetase [glutamine-hydrolyzing]-like n=1 Tax=Watersipora subatra TaxID=2589382 RepID=UPI00355C16AF